MRKANLQKYLKLASVLISLIMISLLAQAEVSLPYTFKAGDPIRSAEVNANFSALSSGLNDLSAKLITKQNSVSGKCNDGSAIKEIKDDGSVVCEVDDIGSNGVGYTAGNGLSLTGSELSINAQETQKRVAGLCPSGSSIREIKLDGTVTCETDDVAAGGQTYSAGTGLSLTADTFSLADNGVGTSQLKNDAVTVDKLALPLVISVISNSSAAIAVSNVNIGLAARSTGTHGLYGETLSTSAGATGVTGIRKGSGANGAGVQGFHEGSGQGVYGFSSGGVGIFGSSSTGKAGQFDGEVLVTGKLTSRFGSASAELRAIPMAYGNIGASGNAIGNTPNVSSTRLGEGSYRVSIGEAITTSHTIVLSSTQACDSPGPHLANSAGGNSLGFLVSTYRLDGTQEDCAFSFVVFRP